MSLRISRFFQAFVRPTHLVRVWSLGILIAAVASILPIIGCGSSEQTNKGVVAGSTEDLFSRGKAAYTKRDWLEAIRLFEEVRVQAPTSELASESTYLEAMSRYNQEMFSGAAVDFRAVRRNYPSSPLAARSQYMIGESYNMISPKPELDQSWTLLALGEYQTFLREYPTAPASLLDSAQKRIVEIRNKLAEKNFDAADLYVKLEDPKSALVYYNRVLDQYYDTPYAAESELRVAELQYDRSKIAEARTAIGAFEDKYLQSASQDQRTRALKLRSRLPNP